MTRTSRRITHQQGEILRFIARTVADAGHPPTVREICAAFRFSSSNGARCHLLALERHGCITRQLYHPRGIALTDSARAFVQRPASEAA